MARPREFRIDDAVGGAMAVFWERGYTGAALPELLDGMGITRGSFYKAFGAKKALFLKVLARYEAEAVVSAEALLADPARPGPARVIALMNAVIDLAEAGDRRGCLLCTAAAGAASEDADIAVAVHRLIDRMTAALAGAVGDAALGQMLTAHYVGLRTLVRAGTPVADLRAGVRALERSLSTPPGSP